MPRLLHGSLVSVVGLDILPKRIQACTIPAGTRHLYETFKAS